MKRFTALLIALSMVITGFVLGSGIVKAFNLKLPDGYSGVPAYVSGSSSFDAETKTAIHNAATAWNGSGANGGKLIYRSTTDHNVTTYPLYNGQNQITKTFPSVNEYLMETNCFVPGTANYCVEFDININGNFVWKNVTPGEFGSYDVQNCMTHEFGHALGLDDHYTDSLVTMYAYAYQGETDKRTLAQDDINGVKFIYDR